MAEQSFKNHAHRPTPTAIVWMLALIALSMMGWRVFAWSGRDWALALTIFAVIELGYISRVYIVALQDRIIMLEMKVRVAELLPAGEDLKLAKLTKGQIVALRFASDDELAPLLDRAVREQLKPKDIKAAIKSWRPDLYRT
jgi:hypothetical protein